MAKMTPIVRRSTLLSLKSEFTSRRLVGTSEKKSQGILESTAIGNTAEWSLARPYSEVPGPTPLPLIGNTWRLLPYVGQYQISDLARVSQILFDRYGKVRLQGSVRTLLRTTS